MLSSYWQSAEQWLWGKAPSELPVPKKWAVLTIRLLYVLFRDITDGQITLRAMGLVYTSLLSLAPLLAITFSMLKAFGINDVMRPALMRFLAPLGDQAEHIADIVIGFVDNIKVGILGVVGLVLLLYAVIALIQKVESACNYIWQVGRSRSLSRRFSEYLSVLIVGPLLLVTAGSMTASVASNTVVQYLLAIEPFGTTLLLISKLAPYLLWIAGFTFLYLFMPNTKVRFGPALVGGIVAGILWQTASFAFATFASAGGKYNAIYASFAILIFLLIWLYISWVILLLGCRVAFLIQHPEQLRRGEYPPRAGAEREEELTLLIMGLIAHAYINNDAPWRTDRLAHYLHSVPAHVYNIIERLLDAHILLETGPHGLIVPQRDIDTLSVLELLDIVRAGAIDMEQTPRRDKTHRRVADIQRRLKTATNDALEGVTVRDLGETSEERLALEHSDSDTYTGNEQTSPTTHD